MRRNQVKDAKKRRRRQRLGPVSDRRHLMDLGAKLTQAPHSRRYDLWPGSWNDQMGGHPWARVDLRIARSRKWMLREARLLGNRFVADDPGVQGCVIASTRNRGRGIWTVIRDGRGRIASLLLNEQDLLRRPSEIIAHEAAHAAMRFMDVRGVNPSRNMESEEALAYTIGELVKQANRIFYAHAFRQGP
jgi:hypothetical protein